MATSAFPIFIQMALIILGMGLITGFITQWQNKRKHDAESIKIALMSDAMLMEHANRLLSEGKDHEAQKLIDNHNKRAREETYAKRGFVFNEVKPKPPPKKPEPVAPPPVAIEPVPEWLPLLTEFDIEFFRFWCPALIVQWERSLRAQEVMSADAFVDWGSSVDPDEEVRAIRKAEKAQRKAEKRGFGNNVTGRF